MKSKYDIHISARQGRGRKPGDAPDIGRVAKIPGAGDKRGKVRRKRRGDPSMRTFGDKRRVRKNQARRFAIKLWLSLILLACCGAIAAGLVLWLRSQGDRKNIAQGSGRTTPLVALAITDFTPPSEGEALRIFQNALAARDEATLREFVRETPEVDPDDILAYLADTKYRDGNFASHQWIGSSDTDSLQIQNLRVIFEKDLRSTHRIAHLVPDASGKWQLDFPAFAYWSDPPIHRMDTADGYPGGRVRGFISRYSYFNGPFSDDREWDCIAIVSPDSDSTGFGYVRIGSAQQRAITALLKEPPHQARAILEIERRDGAEAKQFEITAVLADGWVLTGDPFDAHYE